MENEKENSNVLFKVGDLVELKSGSPPMTVVLIAAEITVQWFAKCELHTAEFPAVCLQKAFDMDNVTA